MALMQDVKGTLRTLFWLTREEWNEMDQKFYRIGIGVVTFIIMGLFWFFFMRNITGL